MSSELWNFSMWVEVNDPWALRDAALVHPDRDPDDDLIDLEGAVDINACLVLLLDNPIPGCEISRSSANPD